MRNKAQKSHAAAATAKGGGGRQEEDGGEHNVGGRFGRRVAQVGGEGRRRMKRSRWKRRKRPADGSRREGVVEREMYGK